MTNSENELKKIAITGAAAGIKQVEQTLLCQPKKPKRINWVFIN